MHTLYSRSLELVSLLNCCFFFLLTDEQVTPYLAFLQPLETIALFSDSMNLTILETWGLSVVSLDGIPDAVLFLKEEDLFSLQFLEATSSNTIVPALPTVSHHGGWHHGKRSQNEARREREKQSQTCFLCFS